MSTSPRLLTSTHIYTWSTHIYTWSTHIYSHLHMIYSLLLTSTQSVSFLIPDTLHSFLKYFWRIEASNILRFRQIVWSWNERNMWFILKNCRNRKSSFSNTGVLVCVPFLPQWPILRWNKFLRLSCDRRILNSFVNFSEMARSTQFWACVVALLHNIFWSLWSLEK